MSQYRTRSLARQVRYALVAGLAGAFLIPQAVYAGPVGETVVQGGASVGRPTSTNTVITSTTANNVITWRDYSVNAGESVNYDTKNYLNLVTGGNTSAINGSISGGGNIYLVNPNGVIFGKTASVNVGNLYVSTQDTSTVNQAAFMGGASPLSTSAVGKADVVNMGDITANKVEVTGKSIRFLNAANVHTPNPVIMNTDTANGGTAHIGYRGAAPATTAYKINGASATAADNYYQLVGNRTELQNINNNLSGNYMLENNIDFAGNALTPIGGNTYSDFSGKFDGNFFQVQNFSVTGFGRAGLFGTTSNARIENIGVTGATVMGTSALPDYAGGLIGYDTNSTIQNAYVKGVTVDGTQDGQHGGLIGGTQGTRIDSVYSKATIGEGGGIVGYSRTGTVISNAYSDAEVNGAPGGAHFIYVMDPGSGTTVSKSYSASTQPFTWSPLGSNITDTYQYNPVTGKANIVGSTTLKDGRSAATYANWDINNTGAPGAKWRIYEGRTAPLLTAFMSGTSTATYNYRYFKSDGTVVPTGNPVKSNNGADVTGLKYNSQYVKIVGTPQTSVGTKANVRFEPNVNTSKVHDYVNTGSKDFDRTNGIRNAGTKAMLWSDQDGPNLRGVNVTIDKRKVSLNDATLKVTRMYNGKTSVTKAFTDALTSGGITSSGFTAEDVAEGSVHLDFTTGNFQANMANKNVGTNKPVTFSGSIGFTGTDAGNYEFDGTSLSNIKGKITITKAPLYLLITKKVAADKIYDGTNAVVDNAMKQTVSPGNIRLDNTKVAPTTPPGGPIPDGAIMRDDLNKIDNVGLKTIADPTYTNSAGVSQIHVGNHKLQYTNVGLTGADAGNYQLYYTPNGGTKTAVTNEKLYLDGKIVPRAIPSNAFKVYNKATNAEVTAQKVYDRTDNYTPGSNLYLSSNAGASGNTGIVARDQGHITFQLTGAGAHFTKSDGTTRTKNVAEATKVAYNVKAHSDNPSLYQLGDYYVLNPDSSRTPLTNAFNALGAGKITPKTLTATVKNSTITKVYDAMREQTDGNRHVITGDNLVTISGVISGDNVTNVSTAQYASKNVAYAGSTPTTQNVTYTAKFQIANAAEAQNYTFAAQPASTPVVTTKTLTGLGKITPRPVTIGFGTPSKIYDGTATNNNITVNSLNDNLSGAVFNADGITAAGFPTTGITSRYGDGNTTPTFSANANAGNRTVEYAGISNALGGNYSVANKQYGTGTIIRRRIDPSGFKVYKADGTVANATKVYDGNNRHTLAPGAYLTSSPPAPGNTGIVAKDYGKVTFALKSGTQGKFSSDAAGMHTTSHVSEAQYVAYDIVARTSDPTNNPLSNYTFGPSGGPTRNLEGVNNANPAHVTAQGSITPAKLQATTKTISKVYDGLAQHTDGNRNIKRGDTVVGLTTMITDETPGHTPVNTSTANYSDKNVARNGAGAVIRKNVNYTAQLTGKYADDYQIVNGSGTVISTTSGSGANKTVTANLGTKANAGMITPRKLSVQMGDVSKTYDGTATNTTSSVTQITDTPTTSVIGTILSGDGISAGSLNTGWQNARTAGQAASQYGRGTGGSFTANANASNGVKHDVRYTGMDKAFKNQFGAQAASNYTVDATVYGKGTINRRAINPNDFKVLDAHGNVSNATKVYDGTSNYNVPAGSRLIAPSGSGMGIIGQDQNKINFALSNTAKFTNNGGIATPNTFEATRVAYNVRATTTPGYEYLLKNYTLNGQNLESGNANVTGAGSITRRVLALGLVQNAGINKVYNGNANLTDTATKKWNTLRDVDSKGNVAYASGSLKLANDGSRLNITSSYMNDAGTAPDKNVKRVGGTVVDKNIRYNITLSGADARNYAFKNGGVTTNAESGLRLAATGKITPKDLSGSFKKITKVYDGTTHVNPAQVGFTPGALVSGDSVALGSHTEAFQSKNVYGDGSTWTPAGGTQQRNWVNYSGLTLTGSDAANYTLGTTARGLGEITPRQINPNTDFNVHYDGHLIAKTYNGNNAADRSHVASVTFTGVPGDTFTHKVTNAVYDSAHRGGRDNHNVTYTIAIKPNAGVDLRNYDLSKLGAATPDGRTFTNTNTTDGRIYARNVYVTVKGTPTKTYDGTTTLMNKAVDGSGTIIRNADQLVKLSTGTASTTSGLLGTDGTKNATTAVYTDKNVSRNGSGAVQNKVNGVTYNLALTGGDPTDYRITTGAGYATVTTGPSGRPQTTGNGRINPLKVNVTFGNVQKTYDGTATNRQINANFGTAASVLAADGVAPSGLTNANITSRYGAGHTDASFRQNPNVVRDAHNNVITNGKDVQYSGVKNALSSILTAHGNTINNYDVANNAYGKGTINPFHASLSNLSFTTNQATKIYDGTRTVKYHESAAPANVKNYITSAKVNIGGTQVNILDGIKVNSANYNTTANVNGGSTQGVTYNLSYTGGNIELPGGASIRANGTGVITRKNVTATIKSPLTKTYDGTTTAMGVARDRNGRVVTNANDLVTLTGLTGNDGAQNITTATYTNKNAGTGNRPVSYNIGIDAAHAGNYRLVNASGTAITGPVQTTNNTINKRQVKLNFADVSKYYDGTATNTAIHPSVSSADAQVLRRDNSTLVSGTNLNGLMGITSRYGTGRTDATFRADPNTGTKSVQYTGIQSAMGMALGADAANYSFANNEYGNGTIRRAQVRASDFHFNINNATKMYDGTKTVVWTDPSTHQGHTDMAHVKRYFQSSTVNLGGHTVPINLADITLRSAQYNDANVANANSVDYGITINTRNFDVIGSRDSNIHHTGDRITPRDLTTLLPKHIVKEYDGKTSFTETNRDFANAMARERLTTIVPKDIGKVNLSVTGTYDSKNATTNTQAEALARTPANAGRTVNYTLTLSGDPTTLANYTIGGNPTSGTAIGKGDIYRKALTVDFVRKVKDYDGTDHVNLRAGDVVFGGMVHGETLSLDQTAADKVRGAYSDSNVSRDANGRVMDKAVSYRNLNGALADLATRNATAGNYVVENDGTKAYTVGDAKGRINPRKINASEVTANFADATKVYDGNTSVKYRGSDAPSAVKNYLTSATVRIGSNTVNITNDVKVDRAHTSYDNKNVMGGAPHTVTYGLNYTGGNFEFNGTLSKTGRGYITRKNITATVNGPLTKVYDASRDVYDPTDRSIRTYRADTGRLVQNGNDLVTIHGLVAGDGATNATTAAYATKDVGTNKRVDYTVRIDPANADNYNLVDAEGNALGTLSTNNNTITPRKVQLRFDDVHKTYDTTAINRDVTARATNDNDARVFARDGMVVGSGRQLLDLNGTNIDSKYGNYSASGTFTPDPNAGTKDVQYKGINRTMRNWLSEGGKDNYIIDDEARGVGVIDKADVTRADFDLRLRPAVKEYDGTKQLKGLNGSSDPRTLLNTDATKPGHSTVTLNGRTYALPSTDVESVTGSYRDPNAGVNRPADYRIKLNVDNYRFTDDTTGVVDMTGAGMITPRKLLADTASINPTKTYDGTNTIIGKARDRNGNLITSANGLVTYRHYNRNDARGYDNTEGIISSDRARITNKSTAVYADKNVAWTPNGNTNPNAAWQDRNNVANKNVNYEHTLSGAPMSNYEFVDKNGNVVARTRLNGSDTPTLTRTVTEATGRINPYEIRLKADPKRIRINDGMPDHFTGTPMGRNYRTGVGSEVLPGEIYYSSNAPLAWGKHPINGYYQPATPTESVYKNYRFVQDPANATALHIAPYTPDANYYNILAQNKMTPDEYAYENASMDHTGNFGYKPEVSLVHTVPNVNAIRRGTDIRTPDIYATDDSVFALMGDIFGNLGSVDDDANFDLRPGHASITYEGE